MARGPVKPVGTYLRNGVLTSKEGRVSTDRANEHRFGIPNCRCHSRSFAFIWGQNRGGGRRLEVGWGQIRVAPVQPRANNRVFPIVRSRRERPYLGHAGWGPRARGTELRKAHRRVGVPPFRRSGWDARSSPVVRGSRRRGGVRKRRASREASDRVNTELS